jgi:hypothetical protein
MNRVHAAVFLKQGRRLTAVHNAEREVLGWIHTFFMLHPILTAIYFPKLVTALTECHVYLSLKIKIPEQQ